MTVATATDVKERLDLLRLERALALACDLAEDAAYMADLEEEIATYRAAWVGAAVTEVATMRAALSGPQVG
jgi:hypothetical protein